MKTVMDHKYLSPVCNDEGCKYLFLEAIREELREANKLKDALLSSYDDNKTYIKELEKALRTAKIRLEICLGRMEACAKKNPEEHQISVRELPAWIEEMSKLLGE